MATTFAAVNDASRNASHNLMETQRVVDDHTPTTPKPVFARPPPPTSTAGHEPSTPTTPKRNEFAAADGPQIFSPDQLMQTSDPPTLSSKDGSLKREGSHRSRATMEDVEMGDVDQGESQAGDDDDSDSESTASDSKRPLKKKKGQRFFCTEFPPCSLSFTRSEHLARHIRKHTGERPFQCHCSRRFSRLDNLRQHAQTVHVNEDIPGDSLAATSTRFQRQIRTDRVRPPTSRSRASTLGSQGGHSRGHSRNLSTSSIASTASSVTFNDDVRRQPQPLAIANDHMSHPRLSINTYDHPNSSPGPSYAFYHQSPSGYSTPTSTTFSAGPGSPQLTSPTANLARSSIYDARHARRLSVPSGPPPFHPHNGNTYPPPYFTPIHSGTSSTFSQSGTMHGSPTSSVYSHRRGESESDIELRRRTWHPTTYSNYTQRPATSGLSYQQTPDDQRPESSRQPAASQVTRLPGIESFDHVAPATSRQQPSPMVSDVRPSSSGRPSTDHGLHQGLTRLDITAANAQPDGYWQGGPPQTAVQTGYFPQGQPHHQHSASMPEQPRTPLKSKRKAWYGGPVHPPPGHLASTYSPQRPSPEDSGSSDGVPTPSTSQGTEYHPVIVNPAGGPVELYHPSHAVHPGVAEEHHHYKHPGYYVAHPPTQHSVQRAPPLPSAASATSAAPPPPPPTYVLQSGHDPRYPPQPFVFPQQAPQPPSAFRFPAPQSQQPDPQPEGRNVNDMGRLEALVAVATSERRATAATENGSV